MRTLTASVTAAAAAACIGLASLTSIPASAQTAPAAEASKPRSNDLVQLIRLLNGEIATADCGALGTALRVSGMANRETTRSQLVANVNNAIGTDATVRLFTASTVNALGDRAVTCNIVKPDPVTPVDRILELSSKRSSDAGLPELKHIAGALRR